MHTKYPIDTNLRENLHETMNENCMDTAKKADDQSNLP